MMEEEKKTITREKHPGRVAQGHKLAALMKKRKKEILHNKEQSTEPSKEQSTEQSKEQSTEQSPEQSTDQSKEQSDDTYVYSVGMLAVFSIGVCEFFAYQAKNKKQANDCSTAQHEQKKNQPPKRRHML